MDLILIISVWIHVIAAIVWIGGMSTLALVFIPLTRDARLREAGRVLLGPVALRFRRIAWYSLLVLVITGGVNTAARGISPSDLLSAAFHQSAYGQTLVMKLLLVLAVLVLSYIHDFRLGPRLSALQTTGASPERIAPLRRRLLFLARLNAAVALLILLFAVALPRGGLL